MPADIWNIGVLVRFHCSSESLHLFTSDQLWDLVEGKELFRHIYNEEGCYDAKLHLAEMIALLGPPPPDVIQRYQDMREYSWPTPVRGEDGRICVTAEEYFVNKGRQIFTF